MKIFLLLAMTLSALCLPGEARTDFDSSQLSPEGREAYQALLSATQFTIGAAGYAGFSREETALRILLKEKAAEEACLSLVNNANHEGGLYGLLGLRLIKSDMLTQAVEKYKLRPSPPERMLAGVKVSAGQIITMEGCFIMRVGLTEILRRLESGSFDRQFELDGKPVRISNGGGAA
jgi:hypothetical protein